MARRMTAPGSTWHLRTLVGLIGVALLSAWAPMHLHLTASSPDKGESVTEVPTAIRLWFNQEPELKLSRIKVESARGDTIAMGKVVATDDPKSFAAPITGTLEVGVYTVKWVTGSPDGHAVRGTFVFTVPAEAVQTAAGE